MSCLGACRCGQEDWSPVGCRRVLQGCIGGLVKRSITTKRLNGYPDDLVVRRAVPVVLKSCNGPERTAHAMANWAGTRTGLLYISLNSP